LAKSPPKKNPDNVCEHYRRREKILTSCVQEIAAEKKPDIVRARNRRRKKNLTSCVQEIAAEKKT
jgi:hypothetical protein